MIASAPALAVEPDEILPDHHLETRARSIPYRLSGEQPTTEQACAAHSLALSYSSSIIPDFQFLGSKASSTLPLLVVGSDFRSWAKAAARELHSAVS